MIRVEFQILGPLRIVDAGAEVPVPARRQRALLVLLLLNPGRVVPADRLIDQLWDGTPPPQAAVTLRSYVSNVRRVLRSRLVTRGSGYCLDVPPAAVDATRLGSGARTGREHLRAGRPRDALAAFEEAVATWRGDPLADIAGHAAAQGMITQLTETYLGAVEGRFEALLALGRHADALPGLEAYAAEHPLREEATALLMLALYRSGRAAEALAAHRSLRGRLREELGIEPSSRLDDLFRRILDRDPALSPGAGEAPRADPGGVTLAGVVGRDRELAAIETRLAALADAHGSLLLIGGEPGVGKTTLLDALDRLARQRGIPVHCGRSPAAAGAPAFWLWAQVVDSLAAGLDDAALARACAGPARPVALLSAAVADRVGPAAPVLGDDPRAQRFQLYEAVSLFVRRAARAAPLVVTLDDIQWADRSSLELISYLTPALATRPILVTAAYRTVPDERTEALEATLATVSREDVTAEMSLTGLGPAGVAGLLRPVLGEVSGELVTMLHERTGGNPFFVRQLTRLLTDDAADPLAALSAPAPPGVRHVVARRLAGLSETARDLLAAAAVTGRDFDLRVAAAAAGLEMAAAMDALDEAVRHGLAEPARDPAGTSREPAGTSPGPAGTSPGPAGTSRDPAGTSPGPAGTSPGPAGTSRDPAGTSPGPDRPRFVHALVQEVVLDGLPAGRAARLHALVAAELERAGGAGPDELAGHLWAARALVGPAAVPALTAAADAAAAVSAFEQAETHLRRALELVRNDPAAELSLLLRLFRFIVLGRGWGDAEVRPFVSRAMRLAETGACRDDTARLWWSLFFFLLDRNDRSYVEVAGVVAAAAGSAGPALRAVAHLGGVFAALDAGDTAGAGGHLRDARRQVEAAPPAEVAAFDEHLHVMLLLIEGYWAALTADRDGYRSAIDAAVALADADGRPFPRAVARVLGAVAGTFRPGTGRQAARRPGTDRAGREVNDTRSAGKASAGKEDNGTGKASAGKEDTGAGKASAGKEDNGAGKDSAGKEDSGAGKDSAGKEDIDYVAELSRQALELTRRFRFGWLTAIAACVDAWADAHRTGDARPAVAAVDALLADVRALGRLGNESILLLLLADLHRIDGRPDAARAALLDARAAPGPYRGLLVGLVDQRLRSVQGR